MQENVNNILTNIHYFFINKHDSVEEAQVISNLLLN